MIKNEASCVKLSDSKICPSCGSNNVIKNGFTANKKQQFICKFCKKRFIDCYTYKAYNHWVNKRIIQFTKEGLGIRSTARILKISTTTLLKRIIAIAKKIPNQPIFKNRTYEVDEMRTFIKNKEKPIWIVYALERKTKKVVNFSIGRRTKRTLQYVTNTLLLSNPKTIYTDKLVRYKSILRDEVHNTKQFGTNHIERKNLSLRTHLKRLNRKTICYSKSFILLQCVLRIYFWG
ncbi:MULTISPECIES: IS1 family transposase [unclassified Flavobacterium]|uniref:IS1 family transposase n=1 Tax=unclassified Flavobacterium TaxID=196869 RepID=UPI0012916634|nr:MULTISPECIES: IS1 family transposase [unclassified Flavobacterium]MQP52684.1 IS1 family transposase [Flavobacterium sp. LMO9]MQP62136.1 IS1 family transposase [Flavobacterium sp. LMO6]